MSQSTATKHGLKFTPLLAVSGDPLDEVTWEKRDAIIQDAKGNIIFKQPDVEVPAGWSQTANEHRCLQVFAWPRRHSRT